MIPRLLFRRLINGRSKMDIEAERQKFVLMNELLQDEIRKKLKHIRLKAGLNLSDLARKTGYTVAILRDAEEGPSDISIQMLSDLLDFYSEVCETSARY